MFGARRKRRRRRESTGERGEDVCTTAGPGAAAASPDVVVDRGCMNETRSIDGASHARSRLALDQFPIHVLPASGHPTTTRLSSGVCGGVVLTSYTCSSCER